ncbi:MAG: hypothetical protein KJN62_04880 [Deltaproteobacteria bacterium]|nr:hypothetical protein [Deltaproteobacteria bacterium]
MNYSFSLSHDGKVIETKWMGNLTGEIIATGSDKRKTWIEKNTKEIPLVLLSDYTEADVEKVTADGLRIVASRFRGIEDNYPGVYWIAIMPTDLKFGLARMWQSFADELFSNTHVVRSRDDAEKLISSFIAGQEG